MGVDWSPLISNQTVDHGQPLTSIGPIVSYQEIEDEQVLFVRPLCAWKSSPTRSSFTVLPPLVVLLENEKQDYSRCLTLYLNEEKTSDRYSVGCFPFFHYVRKANSHGPSDLVIMPFYGSIHQAFGFDRIKFILLPFYLLTVRGATREYSVLWPFFSRQVDDQLTGLRILPFFSYREKQGESLNYSILWPFFSRFVSLNPDKPLKGWHLWPFFGRLESTNARQITCLWPLFKYATASLESQKRSRRDINVPWPFLQFSDLVVEGKRTDYKRFFWPLWGHEKKGKTDYYFLLWPLCHFQRFERDTACSCMLWLFPYMGRTERDKQGRCTEASHRFWPLFSYWDDDYGVEFRFLDLIPLRKVPFVGDFINPLWTLVSYRKTERNSSFQCLWGGISWRNSVEYGSFLNLLSLYQRERHPPSPAQDPNEATKRIQTIHRFLFGTIRHTVYDNGQKDVTLFWLLTF